MVKSLFIIIFAENVKKIQVLLIFFICLSHIIETTDG